MGYTNYFRNKRAFTDAEWKALTADVKKMLAESDIPVANGHGNKGSKPLFTSKHIMFNGVEDDSHETACVTKDAQEFEFCKTARKPYDALVVGLYKLIRKYDPNVTLSSDGGDEVFNTDITKIKVNNKWTYDAADFDVKVGDTVVLPPTPYQSDTNWEGVVTAIGSSYTGYIKKILGVKSANKPVTNLDIVAGILECECNLDTDVDEARRVAKIILNELAASLESR